MALILLLFSTLPLVSTARADEAVARTAEGWLQVTSDEPPTVQPDGIDQRTAVGGCGCPPGLSDFECRRDHCPLDSEENQFQLLAWVSIHAAEAVAKPNVGDPYHCPSCKKWIDGREPHESTEFSDWRAYAINKHLRFNHHPDQNTHRFNWDWSKYGKNTGKEGLQGKLTQVRLAWQNPSLQNYVYHVVPESHLTYSDPLELSPGICGSHDVPWQLNQPLLVLTNGPKPDPGLLDDPEFWAHGISAKGQTTAYTADGLWGVTVWDMADPAGPLKAATLSVPGLAVAVHVTANLLLVATALPHQIQLFDITNAKSPLLVGSIQLNDPVASMRPTGNKLHVALHEDLMSWLKCMVGVWCARGKEVHVFDITDRSQPVAVGSYDNTQTPAADMLSKGPYVLERKRNGFVVLHAVAVIK